MFIFFPAFAPNGEAIKLAIIIIIAGTYSICPVVILPTVEPIDEINVIASEDAIVILVGIFKTTSIIGTSKNAPAAPTIPAPSPTIKASKAASHLLNVTWSNGISSTFFLE